MVAIPHSQSTEIARGLRAAEADLSPETAPEAIRASQRREVLDYLRGHPGADAEEIGRALVLPAWTVECRLCELAGLPVPYRRGRKALHEPAHPWKSKSFAKVQREKGERK